MVTNPVTCDPAHTLTDVDALCAAYRISGVPVVDEQGVLVGIVTNRDMRYESDHSRRVADVMTPMPLVTGQEGISADEAFALLAAHKVEKLPLIDPSRPAHRTDHGQGLRQVRPVPHGQQGRRRPFVGGCGGRYRGRWIQARAGHSSKPVSTCWLSTRRTATRGRCLNSWRALSKRPTSKSSAATLRPERAPRRWSMLELMASRWGSALARFVPLASLLGSGFRR